MKRVFCFLLLGLFLFIHQCIFAEDEIPKLLNFQGRVTVDDQPFTGTGQFKFALVSLDGLTAYWSNDNTSVNGSEPSSGVAVFVRDGIYSVVLGGTGMTPIPESLFAEQANLFLRVWFDNGTYGFEQLEPDQRILPVGYAVRASVADKLKDPDKIVISGEIDSRDEGDEFYDIPYGYKWNPNTWSWDNKYSRMGVKNIPIADLDFTDMPMVNIYYASSSDSSEWHNSLFALMTKEGRQTYSASKNESYISFRVVNNMLKLSWLHLRNREDPNSTPFASYKSGSPSYNVFYKIVIVK